MTKTHIVIDLETLSTETNAAVTSVGLVSVAQGADGKYAIVGELECQIDIEEYDWRQYKQHFDISANTVGWWLGQLDSARVTAACGTDSIYDAASEVYDFIAAFRDDGDGALVYGCGANFDIPILENFLKQAELENAWEYRDVRCLRTLFAEHDTDWKKHLPENGAHKAIEDARAEALGLIEILNDVAS